MPVSCLSLAQPPAGLAVAWLGLSFQGVTPWFESSATLLGGAPDYEASTPCSPRLGVLHANTWCSVWGHRAPEWPPVRAFARTSRQAVWSTFRAAWHWFLSRMASTAHGLGAPRALKDSLKTASRGVRTRDPRTARSYKHAWPGSAPLPLLLALPSPTGPLDRCQKL